MPSRYKTEQKIENENYHQEKPGLEIKKSSDYDKFQLSSWNRELVPANLRKIKDTLKKYGFNPASPIQVNKNYEILRGAHRFTASKELNIPFFYIMIEENDITAIVTQDQAQKSWTTKDAIIFYSKNGKNKEDYDFIVNLSKKYDLSLEASKYICTCLNNAKDSNWNIKQGQFKMKNPNLSNELARCFYNFNKKVSDLNLKYPMKYKSNHALSAIYALFTANIDWDKFYRQLEKYSNILKPGFDRNSWIDNLMEVYNYKCKIKLNLDKSKKNKNNIYNEIYE